MNAVQEIVMTEEAARAAIAAAVDARAEAQKSLDAALAHHAEKQARAVTWEEGFKRAHGAHQEAIDKGSPDKDILATLAKANEAKTLADAARAISEKAAAQLNTVKLALERTDSAVASANGQVLAAIARKEVVDFREAWRELIQVAARLYALRAKCTTLRAPMPAELARLSFDAAAQDGAFPASYRKSRDDIARFLDELASDPDAQFPRSNEQEFPT